MANPARNSTPTSALQAILGMEPLNILPDRLSMQASMRIGMPHPEWDGKLFLANGKPNLNRKGFYKHWSKKTRQHNTKINQKQPYAHLTKTGDGTKP
jgi:hypothetical protein